MHASMDTLHYYRNLHGEIGKARLRRDNAIADLVLRAAEAIARLVSRRRI